MEAPKGYLNCSSLFTKTVRTVKGPPTITKRMRRDPSTATTREREDQSIATTNSLRCPSTMRRKKSSKDPGWMEDYNEGGRVQLG